MPRATRAAAPPHNAAPDALPEMLADTFRELAAVLSRAADRLAGTVAERPAQGAPELIDLANEFLVHRIRAGRRDRYLVQLRSTLCIFLRSVSPEARVSDLTPQQIEGWLHSLEVGERTKKNYLTDITTWLNFAVDRGYVARSPAESVAEPQVDQSPPTIHSPAEVRRVLGEALRNERTLCRYLAICYFAGLRPTETERLREAEMLHDQGLIDVQAHKAKTRQRRLVTINETLAAWLAATSDCPLPIHNLAKRRRRVAAAAQVEWSPDVTRHSFVSYHLAAYSNAAKTALEAGHDERILFRNYRAIVTPAQAAEFWSIRPA